jgi:hypothetical protein
MTARSSRGVTDKEHVRTSLDICWPLVRKAALPAPVSEIPDRWSHHRRSGGPMPRAGDSPVSRDPRGFLMMASCELDGTSGRRL